MHGCLFWVVPRRRCSSLSLACHSTPPQCHSTQSPSISSSPHSDVVSYTTMSSTSRPIDVLSMLHSYFSKLDSLVEALGAYKVRWGGGRGCGGWCGGCEGGGAGCGCTTTTSNSNILVLLLPPRGSAGNRVTPTISHPIAVRDGGGRVRVPAVSRYT